VGLAVGHPTLIIILDTVYFLYQCSGSNTKMKWSIVGHEPHACCCL